jgi:hypothetical protein
MEGESQRQEPFKPKPKLQKTHTQNPRMGTQKI